VVEEFDNTHRVRRERGTSVVEMAIVLPLLLTVVFAIGDFGVAYTRWNSLTNATREGARTGVVFRATCDATAVQTEIETTLSDFAASSGLDSGTITTIVTGACGGTGTPLTVQATAPHSYLALSALAGLAPTTGLSARSTMRNE
jgi:Flp pilus assembly protein TadG